MVRYQLKMIKTSRRYTDLINVTQSTVDILGQLLDEVSTIFG